MPYSLDTNTCIEYLKRRNAGVVSRNSRPSSSEIFVCSIVRAELSVSLYKRPNATNAKLLADLFAQFQSLPFDDLAANEYGRIRAELECKGQSIGPHDTEIAAIALLNGLTLVTHNVREFSRVNGLAVEDWQPF
jgi:tRNA(fMet)-specific endonuclease VapC